jgi:hypothetical protein
MVFKSVACVALVRKAADEIRIAVFVQTFSMKKINELLVTGNKLTYNFAGRFQSGLEMDVARGPPVGPHCSAESAL